jgi:integrase
MGNHGSPVAWRRNEVLGLAWRHVDLESGEVSLGADQSKADEARKAFLLPDLLTNLRAHRQQVEALQRRLGRVIPRVFVRLRGKLAGNPVCDCRKRWMKACNEAGVPGLLVHDLRRSGVRNMVRDGITEGVAMRISGHRTRSVFARYNMISRRRRGASRAQLRAQSSRACYYPALQHGSSPASAA